MDNHVGYRYLNRLRTEELLENQFEKKIKEKEKALELINPEDKEEY